MNERFLLVSDFRVFVEDTDQGKVFSVHEVYYFNDNPIDYCTTPYSLTAEDEEDLMAEIQLVLEGFSQPYLSHENFPNEY